VNSAAQPWWARPGSQWARNRAWQSFAHPAEKIEYARLLHGQGKSYGEISAKTSIPKASLHRYLAAQGCADAAAGAH
jgi:hypothetical protein